MGQKIEKTDVDKVSAVWDEFARKYGLDRRTSTPDAYLVDMEVRTLIKYVTSRGKLLDVGCGNGYTAIKLAQKKAVEIIGIDASLEMINYANKMLEIHTGKLKGTVQFKRCNILSQGFTECFEHNSFDIVLTKRTLINVLSWDEQKYALTKLIRLLKPKGMYIMIEGTIKGYENMNRLREKFGLSKTPIRWHNNYLDEEKLIPFLSERLDIICARNFSSTYYVGSRVIQPIVLKPFGREPRYDFFLNRLFSYLPSFGNYGIQKLFICRRKEN